MYSRVLKRAVDLTLAAAALVALLPVFAVVSLGVWWDLGWPVMFRQQRAGLAGAPFTMIKFRSMRDGVDAQGRPLPDAVRLTRLGQWLRRCSLDELPEIINVLRGDMSIVGPRPLPVAYLPRYTAAQARRHEVKPGVTGLAQIRGRNATTWARRLRLDVWYVDHQSPRLDAAILFATPVVVFRGSGVSQPGHATMTEFSGTPAAGPSLQEHLNG